MVGRKPVGTRQWMEPSSMWGEISLGINCFRSARCLIRPRLCDPRDPAGGTPKYRARQPVSVAACNPILVPVGALSPGTKLILGGSTTTDEGHSVDG